MRGRIAYREKMPPLNSDPIEVLILGDLIVRRDGAEAGALTPSLAEALILLAAYGRPVPAGQITSDHRNSPDKGSVHQYISRLKNEHRLPVVSGGPRGGKTYQLDARRCRVDAADFVTGVAAGRDIDGLLRLWRGGVPQAVLASPPWGDIRAARTRLIERIAGLRIEERLALRELARFTALFPDDRELDPVRPHGRGSRPRLLVVEDSEQVLGEISSRLKSDYDIIGVPGRDEWRRDFRDDKDRLGLIDGALIDLHLTRLGNDFRGREIAGFLCEHTQIPAALVTANPGERSEYRRARNMEELRLVDIVNKQGEEWYEELESTARLLVGQGVKERQHRMRTWLAHAYRKVERDTENAAPGSVASGRRRACFREYQGALGLVEGGDLDEAQRAVDRFCGTWSAR